MDVYSFSFGRKWTEHRPKESEQNKSVDNNEFVLEEKFVKSNAPKRLPCIGHDAL